MTLDQQGLADRIATVLGLDPAAGAVEFDGRWRTWGQLRATAEQVAGVIEAPGTQVGILLRNRPPSIGLVVGVLLGGGCVVAINPARGTERTRREVDELGLSILAGEPADIGEFVAPGSSATTVHATDLGRPVVVAPGHPHATAVDARPSTAVRMLTSGTTGPPKRVDLSFATLERVLTGAKHYESSRDISPRLGRRVAVVNAPLVHLGGLFRVLQCVTDGRPFCFLERFTVEAWVDAVRRHRPATASLVPAALRMVLEADLDAADLGSLRSVVSGTAPLDPDDADAFTAKYGVPVLVNYAATEFGGGVAGWNIQDYRRFWATKRGSVGRAHAGCELRVVDPDSGEPVVADADGLLEVRAGQLGSGRGWVRTTDLARIDDDGFVWILGRADQAIIRGGFKVRPDDVRTALERHPEVRGAAVIGITDRRLGAVPVAAVELRTSQGAIAADDLRAHAATLLAPYELPADIRFVERLPRTASGKVDLTAVRALFEPAAARD